jgi:hypothetical protein
MAGPSAAITSKIMITGLQSLAMRLGCILLFSAQLGNLRQFLPCDWAVKQQGQNLLSRSRSGIEVRQYQVWSSGPVAVLPAEEHSIFRPHFAGAHFIVR